MSELIVGKLTHAGTMSVGNDHLISGVFISMTYDQLRAIKHLPMYREVAVTVIEPAKPTDTARLDWLESRPIILCADSPGWSAGRSDNFQNYAEKLPTIRAAIDAAMSAPETKTTG